MFAKDVMTTKVITVLEDTSVEEVARVLVTGRISAVPVIDVDDQVVCIVSEGDLVRRSESGTEHEDSWWLTHLVRPDERARAYAQAHGKLAKDVMTADVVVAGENDSLASLAQTLEKHRIKRVPVLRNGKLVGIVSRANLLQGLAAVEIHPDAAGGSVDSSATAAPRTIVSNDQTIRASILNTLHNEIRTRGPINIIVAQGIVDLWGGVETEAQHQAIRAAAGAAPHVTAVNDYLMVLPSALQPLLHEDE